MLTAEVIHFLVMSFLLQNEDPKCTNCLGTKKYHNGGPCYRCGETGLEPVASGAQIHYLSEIMEVLVKREQMFRHDMNKVEDVPQMYRAQTSTFIETLLAYVPVDENIRINYESKWLISQLSDIIQMTSDEKIKNLALKGQRLLREGVDWAKFVRINSWADCIRNGGVW